MKTARRDLLAAARRRCSRSSWPPMPAYKGLDEALAKGWTVVSMKDDWKRVFPFEK